MIEIERGRDNAGRMLQELGTRRASLVRLSVRRRGTNQSLALNVPDPAWSSAAELHGLL